MKEYCIYNDWGGTPFVSVTFKSFNEAYLYLLDIIARNEKLKRPYFVDNKFFKNKYSIHDYKVKIYSIRYRECTDWINYDEEKRREEEKNTSKIIFLNSIDKYGEV